MDQALDWLKKAFEQPIRTQPLFAAIGNAHQAPRIWQGAIGYANYSIEAY